MTNSTPLSPVAQAVLDAVLQESNLSPTVRVAAAAIRAAAEPLHWTWNAEMCHKHLISIAAELEAQ